MDASRATVAGDTPQPVEADAAALPLLDRQVAQSQFAYLAANMRLGLSTTPLAAALFVWALTQSGSVQGIWWWLAALLLMELCYFGFLARQHQRLAADGEFARLDRLLLIFHMALGGIWGLGCAWFFEPGLVRQMVLLLTVVGNVTAVASAAAIHRPSAVAFTVCIVLPFALRAAADRGTLPLLIAGATVLLSVSVLVYARQHGAALLEAIRMRFENARLNEALTEQRVRERTRALEAVSQHKSEFLATVSHEIRTPLNAIIGMSGLMLDTRLDAEQQDYAATIRDSGETLLTIINDILDFSKIEAGRMDIEAHPFDLRECVESALDLVAARAAEKRLDLAYVFASPGEGEPPAAVLGDVTRLRQILLNLLSNAVKFTEAGEVVLTVRAEGSQLQFTVRDTGIGLSEQGMARLFQSCSQADSSTTRKYGGTGLGLAISKKLAELMGGRIWAESAGPGQGSSFHACIEAPATELPATARRGYIGPQPALKTKHLLVVDDNPTNRRLLALQTAKWGMVPRDCKSGEEALRTLEQAELSGEHFDLVVLDMHMPGMDGVTLARRVRQRWPALPLVLFSSLGRRELGVEDGLFQAYLHKPLHQSQLFDTLVGLLGEALAPSVAPPPRPGLDAGLAARHPLRILPAEDNVVNQKLALRLLQQMGYRADLAGNGIEAVECVIRQTYDVVLMDVQMPEMDGLQAAQEICRRWPADGRPRLVAMTANAMQGDREACLAAGMDDYVTKPIRVEALVAALMQTQAAAGS